MGYRKWATLGVVVATYIFAAIRAVAWAAVGTTVLHGSWLLATACGLTVLLTFWASTDALSFVWQALATADAPRLPTQGKRSGAASWWGTMPHFLARPSIGSALLASGLVLVDWYANGAVPQRYGGFGVPIH